MKVISYQITLLEPLLATRLEGDPNNAVSYSYIPGSQIRGAVVAAYLRAEKPGKMDAGSSDLRPLFFDAQTRYLNAYPLAQSGRRMLPTPYSWQLIKGREDPVFDFALAVRSEIDDEYQQFQPIASGHPFCSVQNDQVELYKHARQVNIHTARDRRLGRATKGSGAVFQYDAIAAGQEFGGAILIDADVDARKLAQHLRDISVLGGSSSGGYGRVCVDVDEPVEVPEQGWREAGGRVEMVPAGAPFVVTMLSDTILRDRRTGQYTTDPLPMLHELLGPQLADVGLEAGGEEQRPARHIEITSGFNRTWGLPLPQVQAIGAGCVFVLTSAQPIDAAALWKLEWRGLGERRAEGFGRLAFNWQRQAEISVNRPRRKSTGDRGPELTGVAARMAEEMAERLLRRDLDAALIRRLNTLSIDRKGLPSRAQLARFRVIAREALGAGSLRRLTELLESIDERRSARDQFDRARIQGKKLSYWLSELLQNPSSVWKQLGVPQTFRQLGSNVKRGVESNDPLAIEYTIRLVDGLMAKAARERNEDEEKES